jgi:RNA polymerase sigma factor (sigma-70 family)
MRLRHPKSTARATPSTESPKFEQLYKREYHRVLHTAVALVRNNASYAEDLTHEAFLRAVRTYGMARLEEMGEGAVHAILIRTVKNLVVDMYRLGDTKLILWEEYKETDVPLGGLPDEQLDHILQKEAISRFFDRLAEILTEGEWRVAMMAWGMDKSDAEIAQEMGTTRGNVKTLKWSARKKIKECAVREGAEITFSDTAKAQRESVPGAGEVTT